MSDASARTRILVVEDQPLLLRGLVKALGQYAELEVVGTASDGEVAVQRAVELAPDLILLDLELPSLDGIEVTRRVRRRLTTTEVLILTTFDDERKVYEAIQAGASGYLVKRVGPDKIRSAIAEVMGGGTVLEPIIARRFWHYFQSQRVQEVNATNPWGLTEVEIEVLRFVAKGLSNAEVGRALSIERRTVRTHLAHVYDKMRVSSHVDAVVLALRAGTIDV